MPPITLQNQQILGLGENLGQYGFIFRSVQQVSCLLGTFHDLKICFRIFLINKKKEKKVNGVRVNFDLCYCCRMIKSDQVIHTCSLECRNLEWTNHLSYALCMLLTTNTMFCSRPSELCPTNACLIFLTLVCYTISLSGYICKI